MSDVFLDKAGVPVNVNDFVVYGYLRGTTACLRYAKVLEVKLGKSRDPLGGDSEDVKLTAVGVDDDLPVHLKVSRKATLAAGDRVIKLTRAQMPDKVLKLLDGVTC